MKKPDASGVNSIEPPLIGAAGDVSIRFIAVGGVNSSLASVDSSILIALVVSDNECVRPTEHCFPRLSFGQENLIYPFTLPSVGRLKTRGLYNPNVSI